MNNLRTDKKLNGTKHAFGIIEIFGFLGILLWATTFLVRQSGLISGTLFDIFQVVPNIACGWIATAFFKQFIEPAVGKKSLLNIKLNTANYAKLCSLVLILGICSEVFYVLIKNGKFDWQDIVATVIGQTIVFIAPILLKSKSLGR